MKKEKNEPSITNYNIPVSGSLGLLALGDVGLRAWRKVRDLQKKTIKK